MHRWFTIDWIPIVLLTLVTYNIKLYLPPILIQSPCLFMYTPGHVYNSALTLWRPSRLHDGLDWSVGDSINVLNILESVVFLAFHVFFKPSESTFGFPKMQEMAFQRLLDLLDGPPSKSWLHLCDSQTHSISNLGLGRRLQNGGELTFNPIYFTNEFSDPNFFFAFNHLF